ncbi:MAG: hypothetical protein IPH62_04945 [Ignavibacteriae bacterium]|nr:hypothetical protein [Ignavibacteriota bacterium]
MKKIVISILAILFLLFLFLFWGGKVYTKYTINSEIDELRSSVNFKNKKIFYFSQIENQPKLIKKYFKTVIDDSSQIPNFITLNQSGEIKTEENSNWLKIKSAEYFTTQKPNLLLDAEIGNSKFFWIEIVDSYLKSKGNTLIKINSSVTIGDSWGIEIDKSNLFKYLSEAVYFPSSLLPSENLIWNILDSNIAEIKFTNSKTSVVAKLFFSENETINKIETLDKFRPMNDNYKESLFTIYFSDYKKYNSFLIPTYCEVEWELEKGKFKFGKFKIDNIKYE